MTNIPSQPNPSDPGNQSNDASHFNKQVMNSNSLVYPYAGLPGPTLFDIPSPDDAYHSDSQSRSSGNASNLGQSLNALTDELKRSRRRTVLGRYPGEGNEDSQHDADSYDAIDDHDDEIGDDELGQSESVDEGGDRPCNPSATYDDQDHDDICDDDGWSDDWSDDDDWGDDDCGDDD